MSEPPNVVNWSAWSVPRNRSRPGPPVNTWANAVAATMSPSTRVALSAIPILE
jgi:hypothetical protein